MNKRGVEIAVGVFVLIGLACVAYLTIRLGKMEIVGGNYYPIQARFASVSGLSQGGSVTLAGVEVGKVSRIALDKDDNAVVTMEIDRQVKLSDDTSAAIKTNGLIGDKYIALSPGGSGTLLAPTQMITDTQSGIDIEEILGKYAFGSVSGGASSPASNSEPTSAPAKETVKP